MTHYAMEKSKLALFQSIAYTNDEEDRKRRLFILLAIPGTIFLAGFGLLNIFSGNPLGGWLDCLVALSLLACILCLHRLSKPVVVYRLNAMLLFGIMCFWTADGGQAGEKILWSLIYPLMVFFLLDRKEGLAWSGALLIAISLMFAFDGTLPVHAYPFGMKMRVFFVYLASSTLTYSYELSRQISQNRYAAEQAKLNAEKKKLADATRSLQSANDALQKSEALLKHAQTIAHVGNWEYDYRSRTFWCSEEIFKIFGLKRPDPYFPLEEFKRLVPSIDQLQARMSQAIKQDAFLDIEFDASRRTDEAKLYLHARAELTRNEEGRASKLTGVLQDMTARKVHEAERRELRERLARSQKMEALGLLAGGVAHDLNNVMTGIVSYPDFLLSRMQPHDSLYVPLKKICESGRKAAAIVEDLLTLARRGVTTTEVLNFNAVVQEYLQSPEYTKLKSHHRGVQFHSQLERGLLNVTGSALHLKKTVMNLVSNAAEAIEGKGMVSIITANSYVDQPIKGYSDVKAGEYVLLRVGDNGSGIDENDLSHIFEPFYTKKIMGRSGTGLGMAVVWGAIKDHSGYIDVQSRLGQGTRIDVYLPITRETAAQKEISPPRTDYLGKGETILVIDDFYEQREVACKILESLGYTTHAVESGEAAVAYLKKHSADLLVLDMIMDPGMDGLDTYKAILDTHPNQKAIIVSGYSETDRVKTAQAMGASAYLKKPYALETLGMAVRTALDR